MKMLLKRRATLSCGQIIPALRASLTIAAIVACFPPNSTNAADGPADDKSWKTSYEAAAKAASERNYQMADRLFSDALSVAENFKPGDTRLRQTLEQLAKVKYFRGDFTNAAPAFSRLVALTEQASGARSEYLVNPLYFQGRSSSRIGQFESAHQALKRGEEVSAWKWGSFSSQVGYCRVARAEALFLETKYVEAEPLYAAGLKLMGEERSQTKLKSSNTSARQTQVVREVFRPSFSEVAEFSRQQAWTKFKLGKVAEAEDAYRKLINLVELRLDEDARIIPNIQRNFAQFYMDQKRWVEADSLLRKAIPAAEKAYGTQSVTMLNYLRLSLRVHQELGRESEVQTTQQRINEIQTKAMKKP